MKRVAGIEIRDISEENIVSEPILKTVRQYEENSKLWKGAVFAFAAAVVVNYAINTFFGDRFEGGFTNSRLGFFLISFMSISFIAFAVFFIKDRRFANKKWHCPVCDEKYPYYKSQKELKGKGFLLDCHTVGIRQAQIQGKPFILPKECPNCHEKMWKE